MIQQATLETLTDIRSGYTLRGRLEDDLQGDIRVLQIRDLVSGTPLVDQTLPRIHWHGARRPPLLMAGDIVLPGRGERYPAMHIEQSGKRIASGQLFVIRPKSDAISPAYLCWYLNQPAAQRHILTCCTGSSIPMLGIDSLGALPVPVPSLETQRKIVALQRLWEQEKQLTEQLLHNRETMLASIFQHLLEQ